MSFDLDERQVLRLAMAANGPVNPLPEGSSVTLEQLQEIRWNQHLTNGERQERLEQVRRILRALDNDVDLDARMKSRGMFSVSELIQGTDIDKWTAHTGVNSLETFEEWLLMKRRHFDTLRGRYETGEKSKDDELFEWVFAHSGVFNEVHVNFKAMKARMLAASSNDKGSLQ
ncbi:hypothetical protein [Rhizobium sp. MHM7A]|uniref:hypothetical protein n=1 Tax=Rhizobium sp. MHM7A TaxID=2583233 RepID=UPI00110743E0|nr:hypothetical protein [Rhizobium sp. MHM7A]TLX15740.1 hypothetical protein FFR93_00020 [Rhizobium sp. MHM7A]